MKRGRILLVIFLCLVVIDTASGQTGYDTLIAGTWKGTSLCQVKNSPCHDEQVVYHISKTGNANEFSIQANKIVNGAEEDMGTLKCVFNAAKKELVCSDRPEAIWTFKITNMKMDGTLYYKKQLYRIISLTKSS